MKHTFSSVRLAVCFANCCHLKQNKAMSACRESTKGDNLHSKVIFEDVSK